MLAARPLISQARFQGHRPHMARAAATPPLPTGAFGWLPALVGLQPCRLIVHPQLLSTSSRPSTPTPSLQLRSALPSRSAMSLAPYSIDYLFSSITYKEWMRPLFAALSWFPRACSCSFLAVSLSVGHFALNPRPQNGPPILARPPARTPIGQSIREVCGGSGRAPTL